MCGWFEIDEDEIKYLCDYSGRIKIIGNIGLLIFRNVVGVEGVYDYNNNTIKVISIEIMDVNKAVSLDMLTDNIEVYLNNSYLYNLKEERLELLKKLNLLEDTDRHYLTEKYRFIELKSPVF